MGGARYIRIIDNKKPPMRVPGFGYTDTRRGSDGFTGAEFAGNKFEGRSAQVVAIEPTVDTERFGNFTRTVGDIDARHAAFCFDIWYVVERFNGADQNARAITDLARHNVAAVVHAVGEIHVETPGFAEHGSVAGGLAAVGVTSLVVLVIALGLDNPHAHGEAIDLPLEHATKELARHVIDWLL